MGNSTASEHLAAMRNAGLVVRIINGRHHYYRLASSEVAALLENMMGLTAATEALSFPRSRPVRCGPRDPALRRLRRCYNHLAGKIAVGMTDAMVARGQLCISDEAAVITPGGVAFLSKLGVRLPMRVTDDAQQTATLCRPCLDWSERRYHLAGRVGSELYQALESAHWFRPNKRDRALHLTPYGVSQLEQQFAIRAAACDARIGQLDKFRA